MSSGEKDLKELMELLNNKAFSNSARLGIMIALYYENRMSFTELLNFSSLPKSSLSFHLQVLEDEGFIKTYKVFSIGGIRTEIKITDNGKQIIKKYLSYIKNLKEENKKNRKVLKLNRLVIRSLFLQRLPCALRSSSA